MKMPLKVAMKIYKKIKIEVLELLTPTEKRYVELIRCYTSVGLNDKRDRIIEVLNDSLKSLGLDSYDEKNGMYSEHLVIFAALSASSSFRPNNILEIGTYNGKTSAILSRLFPNSNITTIDLKDDDPIFRSSYKRDNLEDFIERRNMIINQQDNINFIQANSLHLTFSKNLKNQDLIWVDGAHGYPIVTSDITNCIRLLNKGGVLMCDDVWKEIKLSDSLYSSIASFETISSFDEANILKTVYFKKRIGKRFNLEKKFISYSRINCNNTTQIV